MYTEYQRPSFAGDSRGFSTAFFVVIAVVMTEYLKLSCWNLIVLFCEKHFRSLTCTGYSNPFRAKQRKLCIIMWFSNLCVSVAVLAPAAFAFNSQHPVSSQPTALSMAAMAAPPPAFTSSETAEFPPPLTSLEKLQRAATFWSVALPIVANYYGLIGNLKLQEILGSPMSEGDVEVSDDICILVSQKDPW